MRITIIGESSFLGKSAASLWEEKYELTLLSRKEYSFPKRPFDYSFNWDLLCNSDVIIHCVAAGVQRGHQFSKDEIFGINCFEPIALVHSLETLKYQGQLITFGSYFSLGGVVDWVNEESFFSHGGQLGNDYSLSKYMLSDFVRRKETSIQHTHLILSNLFGPFENPERLFPYIYTSIFNGDRLTFTAGDQIRQFTFVNDLIKALEQVILNDKSGVFHFTNPKLTSVKQSVMEAIGVFSRHHQIEPEFIFGERENADSSMHKLAIDPTNFFETFGSFEFTPLKDALSSYLQ